MSPSSNPKPPATAGQLSIPSFSSMTPLGLSPSPQPQFRYSDRFNSQDAKITYESCDHVRFRIHAIYLEAHTAGLAPPTGMSLAEVVPLTERAVVLELLFQFIYPTPKIVVSSWTGSKVLAEVAEAAEKYQVFPLMSACVIAMHNALPNGALSILGHALKHNYTALADEAAPYVLDLEPATIISKIPLGCHSLWLSYYGDWVRLQREILTTDLSRYKPSWDVIARLAGSIRTLQDLDQTLVQHSAWRLDIQQRVSKIAPLTKRGWTAADAEQPSPDNDEALASASAQQMDRDEMLTVVSKEVIVLTIRRKVLLACAPGFEDLFPEFPKRGTINLPESSSTLTLLLQFLRPVRWPSLSSLSFQEIIDLAYSAEKYKVFHAMYLCKIFIKKALPDKAADIFIYAGNFGYHDILDKAAPLLVDKPFSEVIRKVPVNVVIAWAEYYQEWNKASQQAIKTIFETRGERERCWCSNAPCPSFFQDQGVSLIAELAAGPVALKNIDTIFAKLKPASSSFSVFNPRCGAADATKTTCLNSIKKSIEGIGPISKFLATEVAK